MLIKSRLHELIEATNHELTLWHSRLNSDEATLNIALGALMWRMESLTIACCCMLLLVARTITWSKFLPTLQRLRAGTEQDRMAARIVENCCIQTWSFKGIVWYTATYLFMIGGFFHAIQVLETQKKW
jgi:hypothetical protein